MQRIFGLIVTLLVIVTNVGAQDTLKYFVDYYNKKCPKHLGYFYRVAIKQDSLWYVEDYYARESVLQMNGRFYDDSATKGEGVVYRYHKNSKLHKVEHFRNGLAEGSYLEYDSTGRLVDSSFNKNGQASGYAFNWNEKGQLSGYGIYDEEGKGTGKTWHYYDNGNLCCRGNRCAGNMADGLWTFYYREGGVSCRETWVQGKFKKRVCYDAGDSTKPVKCKSEKIAKRPLMRQLWKLYVSEEDEVLECKEKMQGKKGRFLANLCVNIDGTTEVEIIQPFYPCFDDFVNRAVENLKFPTPINHNRPQRACEEMKLDF